MWLPVVAKTDTKIGKIKIRGTNMGFFFIGFYPRTIYRFSFTEKKNDIVPLPRLKFVFIRIKSVGYRHTQNIVSLLWSVCRRDAKEQHQHQ